MMKKGVSHIEVVLAFLLFLSASIVILYFFSLGDASSLNDKQLYYLFDKVGANVSVDLIEVGVKVNSTIAENIAINTPIEIGEAINASVINLNKEFLDSKNSQLGNNVICINIMKSGKKTDFVYLYLSEDFNSTSNNGEGFLCPNSISEGNYTLGGVKKYKVVSEKRILLFNKSYYNDYNSIKNYSGIPQIQDFSLTVKFGNGEKIEMLKNIPQGVEVFSLNRRIEVLRNNRTVEFADINLRIW